MSGQGEIRQGVDLGVNIAGLRLKNPVLSASGCFGYGEDMTDFFPPSQLGGILTKGLSLAPREGNKPPRIVETASGMLNAIGLNNVGVDAFIKDKMPFIRSLDDTACIANIFGTTAEDYAELARRLSEVPGVHALEMNISCPNVKAGGIEFGKDPQIAHKVVSLTRKATSLPLIVKLSPNVSDIVKMAQAAKDAGADAVSLINTLSGMAVDIHKKRPILSNTVGGLSGPAIKPIALWMVYQVCQKVDIPVIGIGGISNTTDALEFLMVGAKAVQIGTGAFIDPMVMPKVLDGIAQFLSSRGISRVEDWIGTIEPNG